MKSLVISGAIAIAGLFASAPAFAACQMVGKYQMCSGGTGGAAKPTTPMQPIRGGSTGAAGFVGNNSSNILSHNGANIVRRP